MSGEGHSTRTITATGTQNIDGILDDVKWATDIQYSFPSTTGEYTDDGFYSETSSFGAFFFVQQNAVRWILDTSYGTSGNNGFSVEGLTNLGVSNTASDDAHLRFAESSEPSTAWAYSPGTHFASGDVWLGTNITYNLPQAGNYAWATFIHEIGHALGLSHGHSSDGQGALPTAVDSIEYSIMTYRSYVGGPLTGYSNETYGFAQSFMMLDIAALQEMYGADYSTNSGDTVYKWAPTSGDTQVNGQIGIDAGGNRIFATIWDGGGTDTYDLSSYSTDLDVNLTPGEHSVFSAAQLANLGNGHTARGNIFNALLHDGDTRSLIENLLGGSGDDTIRGNAAGNRLEGGDGIDTIYGDSGDDTFYGDEGNDNLYGGSGDDKLYGGKGDDYIKGHSGNDYLKGHSGDDYLRGGTGDDLLKGGSGDDLLEGEENDDTIYGEGGHDTFYGNDGNDNLYGGSGDDKLYGGGGDDYIKGHSGTDYLKGHSGNDRLRGGDGDDLLKGGSGDDLLEGEEDNDTLHGEDGADTFYGGAGDDNLYGGADNDKLYGGAGDDYVKGHSGNDYLKGHSGYDRLRGGSGDDHLRGGTEDDILEGEEGDDLLEGEEGTDTFVFVDNWGDDTITDFDVAGAETLDFSDIAGISGMSDLSISYGGGDTVIEFGANSITLQGSTASLTVGDFVF